MSIMRRWQDDRKDLPWQAPKSRPDGKRCIESAGTDYRCWNCAIPPSRFCRRHNPATVLPETVVQRRQAWADARAKKDAEQAALRKERIKEQFKKDKADRLRFAAYNEPDSDAALQHDRLSAKPIVPVREVADLAAIDGSRLLASEVENIKLSFPWFVLRAPRSRRYEGFGK